MDIIKMYRRALLLRARFKCYLRKSKREREFENYLKTHFADLAEGSLRSIKLAQTLGEVVSILASNEVLKSVDPSAHDALLTLALRYQMFKADFFPGQALSEEELAELLHSARNPTDESSILV